MIPSNLARVIRIPLPEPSKRRPSRMIFDTVKDGYALARMTADSIPAANQREACETFVQQFINLSPGMIAYLIDPKSAKHDSHESFIGRWN